MDTFCYSYHILIQTPSPLTSQLKGYPSYTPGFDREVDKMEGGAVETIHNQVPAFYSKLLLRYIKLYKFRVETVASVIALVRKDDSCSHRT